MKHFIVLASCAILLTCCRRQLVLQKSDVNWYPGTARNYSGPPSIQVRLVNGHGRPLKGHNVHVDEVDPNSINAMNTNTLLGWAPIQRNASGGITLVTDDRGNARISFEMPSTFAQDDLGMHWIRFHHTRRHGAAKPGGSVTCIVPVALCLGDTVKYTPPCYADPPPAATAPVVADPTGKPARTDTLTPRLTPDTIRQNAVRDTVDRMIAEPEKKK